MTGFSPPNISFLEDKAVHSVKPNVGSILLSLLPVVSRLYLRLLRSGLAGKD